MCVLNISARGQGTLTLKRSEDDELLKKLKLMTSQNS
jgi:hypothetical protein